MARARRTPVRVSATAPKNGLRTVVVPPDVAAWAHQQARAGGFGSLDDYLAHLVRIERDLPDELRAGSDPRVFRRQLRDGLLGEVHSPAEVSGRIKAAIGRVRRVRKAG